MMERRIIIGHLRCVECKTTPAQSKSLLTSSSIIQLIRIGWMDGTQEADMQWNNLNDSKAATDTLLAFVKAAPASDQAPNALIERGEYFRAR